MRYLDLTDLVALAAEVSEVETPKLLELLDTPAIGDLLAQAQGRAPHEGAAALAAGLVALAPLPAGNRRLGLLAGLHLLAVNGLEAVLDPAETHAMLSTDRDAGALAAWLDELVTARDPPEGTLRDLLSGDAWRALALAVQRARRHRRTLAGPDDLLVGVFREGTGPAAVVMGSAGAGVEVTVPARPPVPADRPALAPPARKALELAMRASTRHGHTEINTGHLLVGLLDSGRLDALPDDLDPEDVRRRVIALLGAGRRDTSDVARRIRRLADRLRASDPRAGGELDDALGMHEAALDRLVEMIRAWRGDIFLDALAREPQVARLLGHRLGPPAGRTADDRLLADYLADIAQYPVLSRNDEVLLAQCVRTAPPAEAAACQRQLIQANLQLVVHIARKYQPVGAPLLDLIQEGNLGLMRAVERFDPAKGYRLATLATWWVRLYIQRAVGRFSAGAGG